MLSKLSSPVKIALLAVVLITALVGFIRADSDPLRDQISSLQRRLELLEMAFAPQTYREAVEKWAVGVKTRNGAAQYAVLSPQLREKLKDRFDALMWVTGTSSPWVEQYLIASEQVVSESEMAYTVQFILAASTGPAGGYAVELVVSRAGEAYHISRIEAETDGLFPN